MSLHDYFENAEGTGVLATADSDGNVDVAIYARPHVIGEDNVAFIMADRLSHRNVQSNPRAAYLFIEKKAGYCGKRLYLTKTHEDKDPEAVKSMRRRKTEHYQGDTNAGSSVVYFTVNKIRPLIGD